jgi:hypothetical protein
MFLSTTGHYLHLKSNVFLIKKNEEQPLLSENSFIIEDNMWIKRIFCIALVSLFLVTGCTQQKLFVADSWKIDVDPDQEHISLSNSSLGTVLNQMQLNILQNGKATKLSSWQFQFSNNILIIRTNRPVETKWEFHFTKDEINVFASSDGARITAVMPTSLNRFPARVADPQNMQSHETAEENDYTGVRQSEKYFVPSENPHVMYLSLGLVESSNLHALFDKASNTVMQFSAAAKMIRNPAEPSFLIVTVPLNEKGKFLKLIPNYYTEVLGMPNYVPYNDSVHTAAPTGWNHWLAFFRQVTEKDIVDHADFIAKNLKAYGMEHCQLDDGYDHPDRRQWSKGWDKAKFPHGPEWLARYIKSKGLIPGLWTVPYCYSVKDANPDWFLRDDKGNILMDYQGGGELDFSRPEVIQEYWIPLWKEFKRQGWEYYKFDMGNTSWMWYHYQHNFNDTTKSSFQVSHQTMSLFRDIMGPEIWYTNHPDAFGGRMGFIDVAGCGRDPGPGWENMNKFLEVISNNTYQNHIVWYSDPDCIVLRGKPTRADAGYFGAEYRVRNDTFLTLEEARTCASLLCLSGMQFLSGDDLLNLAEERLNLIKKTIPVLPVYPIDLFGRSRSAQHYPEIMDLKINRPAGVYDVITVSNWENNESSRVIHINRELALKAGKTYLVFDNWQEKLTGKFTDEFNVVLPAHGTRVFTIRSMEEHPQLLATNRHITGAVSIQEQNWDASAFTLQGISQTVPDAVYSLFFYLPADFKIDKITVPAKNLVYNLDDQGLLKMSFDGQPSPVKWALKFNKS